MIGLLAAALLVAGQSAGAADGGASLTPFEMGRASVFAGLCSTMGWDTSRERAMAFGEAHVDRNGLDDAAAALIIDRGVEAARVEVEGVIQALYDTGDGKAFSTAMRARCEDLARRYPALMNPTDQTDALFEAMMAEILSRAADN